MTLDDCKRHLLLEAITGDVPSKLWHDVVQKVEDYLPTDITKGILFNKNVKTTKEWAKSMLDAVIEEEARRALTKPAG